MRLRTIEGSRLLMAGSEHIDLLQQKWRAKKSSCSAAVKASKTLQDEPLLNKPKNKGIKSDEMLSASKINQVVEIALNRNSPKNLEVTCDSGPPHMENLVMKVPVGEFVGEEEGVSNKISKKDASIDVLEEEKELPTLSPAEKVKTSRPVLVAPDYNWDFIVYINVACVNLGTMLFRADDRGTLHPVTLNSRLSLIHI